MLFNTTNHSVTRLLITLQALLELGDHRTLSRHLSSIKLQYVALSAFLFFPNVLQFFGCKFGPGLNFATVQDLLIHSLLYTANEAIHGIFSIPEVMENHDLAVPTDIHSVGGARSGCSRAARVPGCAVTGCGHMAHGISNISGTNHQER